MSEAVQRERVYLVGTKEEWAAWLKRHVDPMHLYRPDYNEPKFYPVLVGADFPVIERLDRPDEVIFNFYYPDHTEVISENYSDPMPAAVSH